MTLSFRLLRDVAFRYRSIIPAEAEEDVNGHFYDAGIVPCFYNLP